MAAMGLCEEVYRLPMVAPRKASQEKILAVLSDLGLPVVTEAAAGGHG
jgi:biotin carboxylase